MKVELTPQTAFDFLLTIDSRHPWSLVTERSESGTIIRFTLLIDGTPSAHAIELHRDGGWVMSTAVMP